MPENFTPHFTANEIPADFDLRLTRALETPPPVAIPADFRVAAPAYRAAPSYSKWTAMPLASPRFGLWTLRAAFALLILAMLLFTPWALTRATLPLALEFLLAAEFVALTVWTSLRPHSIR